MSDFAKYHALVADLAVRALDGCGDEGLAAAAPAARLLLADDRALHGALAEGLRALAAPGAGAALRDAAGHTREAYHPLAVHLHLAAFARCYESLDPALWARCEEALPAALEPLREVERFSQEAPPPAGAALALWQGLCLVEHGALLSRDVDIEFVDGAVHHVLARPGAGGSLAPQDPEESLDGWTFRELCGLHALANLALHRRNRRWADRAREVALYHLENTQPDHVTAQPWALFAFLWAPATRSFGEQQLHDAQAQVGSGGDPSRGVAGLLLADAARALAAFK